MATTTYLRQVSGGLAEAKTIDASTSTTVPAAADSGKVPSLNNAGVIDPVLLNASATGGAGNGSKVALLDSGGKIDSTMLPTGIGADTKSITASEALTAGAFVNVYNLSNVVKVRNADWTTGRPAHGFVLAAVTNGANALVYFEGTNNAVPTMATTAIGSVAFLGAAGAAVTTAPVASGATSISQQLGVVMSTTEIAFEGQLPITLAP